MTSRARPMVAVKTALLATLLATCAAALLVHAPAAQAAGPALPAAGTPFQFGVIGHVFNRGADEAGLQRAIREADQRHPAFIVATGIKAARESCSDNLYQQRKTIFDASDSPLVVSLAASDWSACKNSAGRSAAIERLGRLREVFFSDSASLGQHKLDLFRLSSTASFRSYAENAHWEVGGVLFATINLPANNNHFLPEAGRNSEFEDRLVANRAWIKRLFTLAQRRKLAGLVIFSDGDVGLKAEEKWSLLADFSSKQDGFSGPRRQIRTLAHKFTGQVLLIDTQPSAEAAKSEPPAIKWQDNLGHLSVSDNWLGIEVAPAHGKAAPLFTVRAAAIQTR